MMFSQRYSEMMMRSKSPWMTADVFCACGCRGSIFESFCSSRPLAVRRPGGFEACTSICGR